MTDVLKLCALVPGAGAAANRTAEADRATDGDASFANMLSASRCRVTEPEAGRPERPVEGGLEDSDDGEEGMDATATSAPASSDIVAMLSFANGELSVPAAKVAGESGPLSEGAVNRGSSGVPGDIAGRKIALDVSRQAETYQSANVALTGPQLAEKAVDAMPVGMAGQLSGQAIPRETGVSKEGGARLSRAGGSLSIHGSTNGGPQSGAVGAPGTLGPDPGTERLIDMSRSVNGVESEQLVEGGFVGGVSHWRGQSEAPQPAALTRLVATPVEHADWSKDFGQNVIRLAVEGQSTADIHLNPPDWGPIRVSVEMDGNDATLRFSADHAGTRDALAAALPRLRDIFDSGGLTLSNATVSADASMARDNGATGNSPEGSPPAPALTYSLKADEPESGLAFGTASVRVNSGRVDLFA